MVCKWGMQTVLRRYLHGPLLEVSAALNAVGNNGRVCVSVCV